MKRLPGILLQEKVKRLPSTYISTQKWTTYRDTGVSKKYGRQFVAPE